MIPVAKLLDKATELGKEGEKNKKPETETPQEVVQQEVTQQGRRRRTEPPVFEFIQPNTAANQPETTDATNAAPGHWGEGR